MTTIQTSKIQFIGSSYPRNAISAKVQQRVHSHAARTAHAKARRLRIIDHQAGKAKQVAEASQEVEERGSTPRGNLLSISGGIEMEKSVLFSPASLLAADRRDPFSSFARSFTPIEHFLLDHCESLYDTSKVILFWELCCA
jgi:hypothetical protein